MSKVFQKYNAIGDEELENVLKVLKTGNLSQFLGEWGPDFYGGPMIKLLEEAAKIHFGVGNAVTFNSWTSGLIAAVGTLGIEPGDEVIVSPWTMSASAMAILHWNAIPVFADIDSQTYCLDIASVEANISEKTRAIMSIDIFGQSANTDELMRLAKKYGLRVISDSAQAPGSKRNGKFSGTLTDMGGYSLNYHKHIHSGEGGILVTDDDDFAERSRLIRNHAESVVEGAGTKNLSNLIGYNFRMTEIEAAVAYSQLPKLSGIVSKRQKQATYLTQGLGGLPGLVTPFSDPKNTHSYYIYALQIDSESVPWKKEDIVKRLTELGIPGMTSKYQNIHLLPIFQEKIAYGTTGFPWKLNGTESKVDYRKGICPNAERLQDKDYFGFFINGFDLSQENLDFIIESFEKVWQEFS